MKDLDRYVADKNRWASLFGNRTFSLATHSERQRVADCIDCELAPENLYCDGEISHCEAEANHKRLSRIARELIQLDPLVEISEL